MINTVRASYKRQPLHSSVQNLHNSALAIPPEAILLDSLKPLEIQLQKRDILSSLAQESVNPFWFVAETERNVFLWRAGYSLIDADQFEFWVDVPKLLDKRLRQLEHYNGNNPFLNSLWGSSIGNPEAAEHERDYLLHFRDVVASIAMHASALGSIASMIRKEVLCEEERTLVLLPGRSD